jgi:1,2-diacylglycerol 3-alpha-glucosyltransferase
MRKLTIGLFLEHYEPFTSGVISSVKALRHELEQRGHTVYIVCPGVKGYTDSDPYVIRIPGFRLPELDNTTVGMVSLGAVRKLKKIDFDIIHGQEVFTTGMLGLYLARKQKIPYIQSYHTLWGQFVDKTELSWQTRVFSRVAAAVTHPMLFGPRKTLEVFTFKGIDAKNHSPAAKQMWAHMVVMGQAADYTITPSAHLAKTLHGYGLTKTIATIPNGFTPLLNAPTKLLLPKAPKKLRVISVARLSPEKRVHELIKALPKLKNIELIVVGDGPERPMLEKLAVEQKVVAQTRFMGEMSNTAVRELMREADVLALASYDFDNQPMVIIEALDAGLPIVYCDPKLTEGLTKDNALLVDKTPQGFVKGIKKLYDPKKRAQMALASSKLTSGYTAGHMTEQILAVYEAALKAR